MNALKLVLIVTFCWTIVAFGQSPSVEARLIRLEEGQKSLDKRFDDLNARLGDLRSEMNTRFAELREDMNKRFEAQDKRFDTLEFWFQLIMGALVVIIGGLISQWVFLWRRVVHVETVVEGHLKETEKDLLLGYYRKELEELKHEVNKLKAKAVT
jgi:hypothetical protein